MIGRDKNTAISPTGVDWLTVLIYAVLLVIGWISVYAASYDEAHSSIFDITRNYGKQLIWIGISFFLAASILLVDDKYWYILAQPLYWLSVLLLLGTILFGVEVNGARAWYEFGPVRIQPVEFAKITSSLALARIMSSYSFNIHQFRSILTMLFFIGLPACIIVFLQNDTGSALVFGSFLFMLYREGFNGWVYVILFLLVALSLLSFYLGPVQLLILLLVGGTLAEGIMNGRWKSKLIYLAIVAMIALGIYFGAGALEAEIPFYTCLLIASGISLIPVVVYAYRNRLKNVLMIVLLFIGSVVFTRSVEYGFNEILQYHQQKRILNLLGLESDPQGFGYNVNQSKIAIGSGGFLGKGFLHGTQTKYDFVPEQSTDFIFCTIGEEWGFVGSSIVILLFSWLILRLIAMGERQHETFGRIYCYCVAGIFLFHLLVNVGMTIGLMPVIGIPLPFISYGGSSIMAFTILLFIAVKLDSAKKSHITRI